jgi:hypothetical protein
MWREPVGMAPPGEVGGGGRWRPTKGSWEVAGSGAPQVEEATDGLLQDAEEEADRELRGAWEVDGLT